MHCDQTQAMPRLKASMLRGTNFCLGAREHFVDHGFDGLGLENFGSGHISAQHDHVADFAVADLVSDLAAGI